MLSLQITYMLKYEVLFLKSNLKHCCQKPFLVCMYQVTYMIHSKLTNLFPFNVFLTGTILNTHSEAASLLNKVKFQKHVFHILNRTSHVQSQYRCKNIK